MPPASPPTKANAGCLTLFGIPFAGAGLWAATLAAQQFIDDPGDLETLFLQIILALCFGGVGFGLIVFGRYASRKAAEKEALQRQHPNEPWMWRPDWAQRRVAGGNKQMMAFSWAFAIFWNLISAPLLLVIPKEVIEKGNKPALLGLLFPAVGVGLLIWAVRSTLRWRKFGASAFQMSAVPGVIGGRLRGTIETSLQTVPESGFGLKLSCVRLITTERRSGGSSRSTKEAILWQEEQTINPAALGRGYRGVSVPVEFVIPYECEPVDDSDPHSLVIWRLESDAAVPGVDFRCVFEVPVFRTAAR